MGRKRVYFNPLNAELNPICHFLSLLGNHPILHVSRIRVKELHLLPIKKNEMGGAYGTYAERRGACRVLVGKTVGKRQLGKPRLDGRIIAIWIFKKCDVGHDPRSPPPGAAASPKLLTNVT